MSTLRNTVDVVATEDNLGRARVRRATALRRAGLHGGPENIGMVYVVRSTDGGFL